MYTRTCSIMMVIAMQFIIIISMAMVVRVNNFG